MNAKLTDPAVPSDSRPVRARGAPPSRADRADCADCSGRAAAGFARAALLVAAVLAAGCSDEPAAGAGGGGFVFRIPVTVAPAEAGEVSEEIEMVGDVVSRRRAALAFERAGRIHSVQADLGDVVTAGTVLARLDDAVPRQELAVAEAALLGAQADEAYAVNEAERGAAAGPDLLSASETNRREAVADMARAHTAQRRAEIARLTELLAQCELRAPFDGTVVAREVTDGSYALPGSPAFTLVDLARREVWLEIPAAMAADLRAGTPVQLRSDDLPDLQVSAVLDELLPAANLAARTFRGVVRLSPESDGGRLLPGLFVRARMVRRRAQSATIVPADAVVLGAAGTWVAVMEPPGAATEGAPPSPTGRRVPVRVLASDGVRSAVEPVDGGVLETGDMIVVIGAENVFPGAPLAPVDDAAGATGAAGTPGAAGAAGTSGAAGAAGAPGTSGAAGAAGAPASAKAR